MAITALGVTSRPPGWRHAVVVESGIAGNGIAWTGDTELRRGVPQARHQHGLLALGASIIEGLFPGLRAELAEQGAPIFDLGESFHVRFPSGWTLRGASGIKIQTFIRIALEKCIRRRIMTHRGVTVRSGYCVAGFRWDPSSSTVTGVYGQTPSRQAETIDLDLLVDASGRTSTLTTDWFATHVSTSAWS